MSQSQRFLAMAQEMNHKQLIDDLENTGNYRVLQKYQKPDFYNQEDGSEKITGIFLDVETTGLSHENDRIIEIALVPFEFSKDGRIFNLLEAYSGLEDPETPLSQKIISLTGLTDEMLAGKSFDDEAIKSIVESSNLIIAHNANFDRKFVERRFSIFNGKSWACSASQVAWEDEGLASVKLEYLAYKFGYFFEGHRAQVDCYASLHLLSMTLPKSGDLVLKSLLNNARLKSYRIWALGSPFDSKDLLKNRGYRWPGDNGKNRSWYIDVDEESKEQELKYLREEIFKRDIDLPINPITAFNRFSERI
ncbi:MAG: 3'-5' exonuclease [Bacteriovoracaceae bacterium]|nr:3'-5' exonuclease [Bacteriovoracaceae bacterium]